jgi:hypothetical protein
MQWDLQNTAELVPSHQRLVPVGVAGTTTDADFQGGHKIPTPSCGGPLPPPLSTEDAPFVNEHSQMTYLTSSRMGSNVPASNCITSKQMSNTAAPTIYSGLYTAPMSKSHEFSLMPETMFTRKRDEWNNAKALNCFVLVDEKTPLVHRCCGFAVPTPDRAVDIAFCISSDLLGEAVPTPVCPNFQQQATMATIKMPDAFSRSIAQIGQRQSFSSGGFATTPSYTGTPNFNNMTKPNQYTGRAPSKKWSKVEDDKLRLAVKSQGPGTGQRIASHNWTRIASHHMAGTGRTGVQCLYRWKGVLQPDLVKGPWTAAEDLSLRTLWNKGVRKWSIIAQSLPGRIGKQCRERWVNHLDPSINKKSWTAAEINLLQAAQAKMGNRWRDIAEMLPGRGANSVQNKYHSLYRKRIMKDEKSKERKI